MSVVSDMRKMCLLGEMDKLCRQENIAHGIRWCGFRKMDRSRKRCIPALQKANPVSCEVLLFADHFRHQTAQVA